MNMMEYINIGFLKDFCVCQCSKSMPFTGTEFLWPGGQLEGVPRVVKNGGSSGIEFCF